MKFDFDLFNDYELFNTFICFGFNDRILVP